MFERLLFGSAISILVPSLWGQDTLRFDTVYLNQAESFAVGHTVFEEDSSYRVFSIQKGLPGLSQDIFITDFDGLGGAIQERTFQTYQQDWMGASGPVVRSEDGYWAGVARGLVLGPLDSLFLYRFTAEGDTAWTRFLVVDTAYLMRGLARTADGDLLITGSHYPSVAPGTFEDAYVLWLDSSGNVLANHEYLNFGGEDVIVGADGKWYVCGRGNGVSNNGRLVLVRTDSTGSELWRRTLVNKGTYFSMLPLMDHGILAMGAIGYETDTGGLSIAIKYDTTGTELWRREVLQADQDFRASRFQAGYETSDSSIVLCGWVQRSEWLSKGSVVKLNAEGEVLWTRLYSHFDVSSISLHQIFWDVKPTRDGGMVLTGEANSAEYPYAQLWLLKLDSMGCLVPGCESVGVEEYTDLFSGQLLISPNPAQERANVSLTLTEGFSTQGGIMVYVMDVQGRIVQKQPARENLNIINGEVDVTGLPPGTYYIHLADEKRWLAGGKLLAQ